MVLLAASLTIFIFIFFFSFIRTRDTSCYCCFTDRRKLYTHRHIHRAKLWPTKKISLLSLFPRDLRTRWASTRHLHTEQTINIFYELCIRSGKYGKKATKRPRNNLKYLQMKTLPYFDRSYKTRPFGRASSQTQTLPPSRRVLLHTAPFYNIQGSRPVIGEFLTQYTQCKELTGLCYCFQNTLCYCRTYNRKGSSPNPPRSKSECARSTVTFY